MKKYETIIVDEYKTGIWDSCDLSVEVNRDADKYRVSYDYVKWTGNNGSLARKKYYLDGKNGRRLLKSYQMGLRRKNFTGYASRDIWMD